MSRAASTTRRAGIILLGAATLAGGSRSASALGLKGQSLSAVEGSPFSGPVAILTELGPTAKLAGCAALIQWGDRTSSSGSFKRNDIGAYCVVGRHTYSRAGSYSVQTLITQGKTTIAKCDGSVRVAVAPLQVAGKTITGHFLTDSERYVSQLYQDLLGRSADVAGLQFWSHRLSSGFSRLFVAQGILSSAEYRSRQVNGAYQSLLGRPADPAAQSSGVSFLQSGGTVEQLEALLAGSTQYFFSRGGGTNAGFLKALYQDVLGRPIDAPAQTSFLQALGQGASRQQVALEVLTSSEADQALVRGFFQQFLHRSLDVSGVNVWVGTLQQGTRDEQVIAVIVSSAEYFADVPAGTPFHGVVASFIDGSSLATPADFSATIQWGDGTSSDGTIVRNTMGGFDVVGTHTYLAPGLFGLTISILDKDGSAATGHSQIQLH